MLRFNFPHNFISQPVKWDLSVACHITKHISIQTYFRRVSFCSANVCYGERLAPSGALFFRYLFSTVVLAKWDYLYLLVR